MVQQLLFRKKITRQELNSLIDRAADLNGFRSCCNKVSIL